MSSGLGKILPLGLLVAAFGAIYSNPTITTTFLNTFAGRFEPTNPGGTTWKGHGALNNDNCWVDTAGQACEDVRIHYPSSVAFLACGYPETRAAFYPPTARHDTTSAKTYHEYFLKYDIATNITTRLKIEGLDASHDLVLHGIDLYTPADDASKIYMFAVNHDRRGEFILLFSHVLGSDTLTLVREFSHPKVKTPNAVAATSLNSFFISNDHYFYGNSAIGSFLRNLEGQFGPFRWATDIVHCTATDTSVDCESVSPSNSHPSANGILLVDDGKTLMVNDVIDGTTTIYDVEPRSKKLSVRKIVTLGAAADNLSEIPGGDIAVCAFPNVPQIMGKLHGANMLDSSYQGEAAVLRLRKDKNYEPEVLFWDDGSLITLLTGAAVDPVNGRLIAGGVVEKHFVVCDITGKL